MKYGEFSSKSLTLAGYIKTQTAPPNWQTGHSSVPAHAQMDLDHFVCVCVYVRQMSELYEKCSAGGQSRVSMDDFLQAVLSLP